VRTAARSRWILPAGVVALALLVGTVHLTEEAYLDLGGDAPRYLMNGVFLFDLARDAPIAVRDFRAYAEQYYARYPALSLGYHPILPSLLMVPVFGLFGISVFSARIVPLFCFAVASVFLLLLVERVYDRRVAIACTLLFVFSPFAAWYSRTFMSEMPALAAMMAAVYFCERYSRSNRRLDLGLFIASAVVSMYGKQLTVFMLPVYAMYLAWQGGIRRLVTPDLVASIVAAAIVLVPLALITLMLSAHNVRWVTAVASRNDHAGYLAILAGAMAAQVSWPIVALAAIGTLRAVVTRDGRSVLFILWVTAFRLVNACRQGGCSGPADSEFRLGVGHGISGSAGRGRWI
jgi:4-amino-4-deoxy-L-arabinose transferase-like glycosyltransferase